MIERRGWGLGFGGWCLNNNIRVFFGRIFQTNLIISNNEQGIMNFEVMKLQN